MNIKTIIENIVELASEEMTEDGIHHDDWSDHEHEYTETIVKELVEKFEVDLEEGGMEKVENSVDKAFREDMDNLSKLTIR